MDDPTVNNVTTANPEIAALISTIPSTANTQLSNISGQADSGTTNANLQQMRWFQMIFPLALILIVAIGSLIAFCITKSPYSFTPCTLLIAPAWKTYNRITNFLFPQDEKDFQLELAGLKIQRKKRVP